MFAYSWAGNDYSYDSDYCDCETDQPSALAWEDAACRDGSGSLTGLFFSDEIADIEVAKAICSTCSLVEPCLKGALERREAAGVWGGQLFADGQVVAFKRKRGRPPKAAPVVPAEHVQAQASYYLALAQQRLKTA
ncbi:MAG TPA: WhiB family transcriptional regulator [Acidimicrobiales bacterium]|nr:WhiB family transcriptional regulator [Acidimicrobiales bacterium]